MKKTKELENLKKLFLEYGVAITIGSNAQDAHTVDDVNRTCNLILERADKILTSVDKEARIDELKKIYDYSGMRGLKIKYFEKRLAALTEDKDNG